MEQDKCTDQVDPGYTLDRHTGSALSVRKPTALEHLPEEYPREEHLPIVFVVLGMPLGKVLVHGT